MVERTIDPDTINFLSPIVAPYSDMIAKALSLTEHTGQVLCKPEKECFFDLMKVWLERDGDKANLHKLMKVLLKIRCKVGVDKLIDRYNILFDKQPRLVTSIACAKKAGCTQAMTSHTIQDSRCSRHTAVTLH